MKIGINEENIEKIGDKTTIELLGRQNIEKIIDIEINKKLNYKLDRLHSGMKHSRESIIVFEKEISMIKKIIDDFRGELYKLQEICVVINKVGEHLEEVKKITNKLKKMDEEFMIFRLKLLNQEKI